MFTCSCGNTFELHLTIRQLQSGKFRKHCSRSCANRRIHSLQTKSKMSEKRRNCARVVKIPNHMCSQCHNSFFSYKKTQQFCSRKCMNDSTSYRQKLALTRTQTRNPMYGRPPKFSHKLPTFSNKLKRELIVRSSYEVRAVKLLDSRADVVDFAYEKQVVPYVLDGRKHNTIVDFKVQTDTGTILVEVKPKDTIKLWHNDVKIAAMKAFAIMNGWKFELWTEDILLRM